MATSSLHSTPEVAFAGIRHPVFPHLLRERRPPLQLATAGMMWKELTEEVQPDTVTASPDGGEEAEYGYCIYHTDVPREADIVEDGIEENYLIEVPYCPACRNNPGIFGD